MVLEKSFKGSRILIVDDEDVNILLLRRLLTQDGYGQLTSTTDSREAMEFVKDTQPDLILLDLMMPNVDGYQILDQLASKAAAGEYLPVMVLTADVTPQALQRALSAGARDFLTKPFKQTELLLRVHNLLETRHLYRGMQRQLESLEQMQADAMQSILFRDRTLSEISHDIGQPLSVLRLTTDVMQLAVKDEDVTHAREKLAEEVEMIVSATSQMTSMISQLSDLARLQMGRELVLQCADVDLVALVEQQASAHRKSAGRRRIRVEAPDEAIVGHWDVMRLTRVVSNLLANAVRFSPATGEIKISVHRVRFGDQPHVQLSVEDNGVGIPAPELLHVFEPFYRATNVAGKIQGTGLGLASARQIVQQHSGFIDVSSEVDKGTTVIVVLPLK